MRAERIPVHHLAGVTWHRVWKSPNATMMIGETVWARGDTIDRRWVAWHSRRGAGYAFWDERAACELADRWLVRGDWQEQEIDEAA